MQNIDPLFLLSPGLTIAFSVFLVLYWALKHKFKGSVLVYSLGAYATAIALKYVVQIPTIGPFIAAFGAASAATALYYGLQTVFFEVGLAYLFARMAVKREKFTGEDAEAYGIGLSFWENGVLLGVISLLNLALEYLILAGGSSTLAQQVYQALYAATPGLFAPPSQAVVSVFFSVMERTSSAMGHIAWGYLTVMAAFYHKRGLLLIALPMGLLDALVPFAGSFSLAAFEGLVFALSSFFLVVSYAATRGLRSKEALPSPTPA